jgi:hypothetical protein
MSAPVSAPTIVNRILPTTPTVAERKEFVRTIELNESMVGAIRTGNVKLIRRLIEKSGLHPTYVFSNSFNPTTQQFRVEKLRLREVFDDPYAQRDDSKGLDKVMAELIALGMDVTATLPATRADGSVVERTAWGPNLRAMETARDRESRLRALELAMQKGLVPNDDFSEWIFAELPKVCGRDRSEFAIRVTDLLIQYLGDTFKTNLWRQGARGPESLADVLDWSFAPPKAARNVYEKDEFAQRDLEWESCALLSRRINR